MQIVVWFGVSEYEERNAGQVEGYANIKYAKNPEVVDLYWRKKEK